MSSSPDNRLFKPLRIILYLWISIALFILFFGLLVVLLSGSINHSDFPSIFVSIGLITALVTNLISIEKIRKISRSDQTTKAKITREIYLICLIEIVLGAYTFSLQTFGLELAILIGITILFVSTNLIYLSLSKRINQVQ